MPRQLKDLKEFLGVCQRKDARYVKIKKATENTKFKVRCSKYLYTLVVTDKKRAARIIKSINPAVKKINVTARSHAQTNSAKK